MKLTRTRTTLLLSMIALQTACSSGGDSDNNNNAPDDGEVSQPGLIDVPVAPEGDITHYGAVTIDDDAGVASDLVASFYRLDSGVSASFLSSMLSGESAMCQVQDDGVIDFEEISAGFVPTVPGVGKTAVSAGEAIVLSSPAGTYATLEEQPTAGFLFYDLPNMSMLMDGPVPEGLTVDVPGSAEIPAFVAAEVPTITTLSGAAFGSGNTISANTQFTWEPSSDPTALIRIFATTAGGFFLEDGVTVTCVTPDTGSFNFPADTRAQLGADFSGSAPLMSRIVVNPVQVDSTLLYVIRESFM
ncbi:hypothetical protein [Granulosicoccus antarcticus]|uniref:Lipoprotein n=1 Tax=Granulosicoccus antarcticus IMCC3135 TaxID=1192854 RepID=A0A2Z2NX91_9GAMM|nr:hypothetical protein [Granulosicoccus antarcticus]ASJ75853.1 hypothetical protein IMCC3135_29010 [Granulosicoccus antarcticus IMCC3135]